MQDERGPQAGGDDAARETLKSVFNNDAAAYDRYRPPYPDDVYDFVIDEAGLTMDSALLEIGCGTGLATEPFAATDLDITAIEPGANLIAVAQENLDPYPNVKLVCSSFEDVYFPDESFDLIYAAMSLHWVQEQDRFRKPHRLLKAGGHLAILYTWPVREDASEQFFREVDTAARKNGMPSGYLPQKADELWVNPPIDPELFEEPPYWYTQRQTLRAGQGAGYVGYLSTISYISALPDEVRLGFLGDVATLINGQYRDLAIPFVTTATVVTKK